MGNYPIYRGFEKKRPPKIDLERRSQSCEYKDIPVFRTLKHGLSVYVFHGIHSPSVYPIGSNPSDQQEIIPSVQEIQQVINPSPSKDNNPSPPINTSPSPSIDKQKEIKHEINPSTNPSPATNVNKDISNINHILGISKRSARIVERLIEPVERLNIEVIKERVGISSIDKTDDKRLNRFHNQIAKEINKALKRRVVFDYLFINHDIDGLYER